MLELHEVSYSRLTIFTYLRKLHKFRLEDHFHLTNSRRHGKSIRETVSAESPSFYSCSPTHTQLLKWRVLAS